MVGFYGTLAAQTRGLEQGAFGQRAMTREEALTAYRPRLALLVKQAGAGEISATEYNEKKLALRQFYFLGPPPLVGTSPPAPTPITTVRAMPLKPKHQLPVGHSWRFDKSKWVWEADPPIPDDLERPNEAEAAAKGIRVVIDTLQRGGDIYLLMRNLRSQGGVTTGDRVFPIIMEELKKQGIVQLDGKGYPVKILKKLPSRSPEEEAIKITEAIAPPLPVKKRGWIVPLLAAGGAAAYYIVR